MHPAEILLSIPPDFNFEECLWYLDRGYDECLHEVASGKVCKAIRLAQGMLLLEVEAVAPHLVVRVLDGPSVSPSVLIAYVRQWFDLQRDLQPFYTLLQKDPRMAPLGKAYRGLRLVGIPDLFEALCWSVIGQQINLPFAYLLKRRLVMLCGDNLEVEGRQYWLFPTPRQVLAVPEEAWRPMQFSAQKVRYLQGLAAAFATNPLIEDQLRQLPDRESRADRLLQWKGIGRWSAQYALLKWLPDPASIPVGDAGLLNALLKLGVIQRKDQADQIAEFFGQFAGWEGYVVFYLWRSLADPPPIKTNGTL